MTGPLSAPGHAPNPVHHVELWTDDLAASEPSFAWLLSALGWDADHDSGWPSGRIWRHPTGVYLVLEQSPDVAGPHDRLRAGLNHLALRAADRAALDDLRAACAAHGWTELFAERYPHAGGPDHTALFLENVQGFEVEIVAD
ncbi:glyoxalase [Tersicoccus phoenicis]|uniref:Glyoxalase n=1 Tax=Tersicoccus phoenicis TaxID=554083 RepID=A0A1R1LL16_9MICC|nr:VOC family protein [Tersicoccus phoenicis]OMH28179.1 glyoxalase [Tersicoccus phoenicis]